MTPNVDRALLMLADMEASLTDTLRAWIQMPSVKADPEPGAPFGKPLLDMLHKALSDLSAMGFATTDVDGYAGIADMGAGADKDALAILAHLDVVPAGEGWVYAPFGAALEDGVVYGRGTSDDKGPAVSAAYAMLAIKRAGIKLRRKVRLILGCDEESGWADIDYFKKHAVMPDMGFSPDASYPVINIEKGICRVSLTAPYSPDGLNIGAIQVGERPNVVPGTAQVHMRGGSETARLVREVADELGFEAKVESSHFDDLITVMGVPGHAAMPEQALNAAGLLLKLLEHLGVHGPLKTLAQASVGAESDGASLGISVSDGLSGALTCSLGILNYSREDGLYATLDIRYPIMASTDALIEGIRAALPGITVTVDSLRAPHHVRAETALVRGLRAAYEDETHADSTPIAIGGGTYARALKEGVAFGVTFPDQADMAHQANECISIEDLMRSARIFVRAILNLAGEEA